MFGGGAGRLDRIWMGGEGREWDIVQTKRITRAKPQKEIP
jgi:hypothetical protein